MKRGWIQSWRKELESDIWFMPPLYHRVWSFIRLKANWEVKLMPTPKPPGIYVSPGMLITSYEQIADGVRYMERGVIKTPNRKTIKTILNWLESNNMISRFSNRQGTVIFINNWAIYQDPNGQRVTPAIHQRKHQTDNGLDNELVTTKTLEALKPSEIELQGNRGAKQVCSSFSFPSLKKQFQMPEETVKVIDYFIAQYQNTLGKNHPNLKLKQWKEVVDTLLHCLDEDDALSVETLKAMIDRYFTIEFQDGCNYSILHFNTDGIELNRFYEVAY